MAYIGQGIKQGTFKVLDTSGNTYNGSNTTFSLGTQVGSAAQLLVSHDGVIQLPGTDYTLASGGASITFSTAPASGASIFIVEISGAVGGTVTPSDNSVGITQLNVSDGSNGQALTTNGSGTLSFSTISTGLTGIDDQSSSNDDQLTITDTAVVINEDSDDVDFRVEGNGVANLFHVNAGDDRIGINSDADLGASGTLHIKKSDSGSSSVNQYSDNLIIEEASFPGMSFLSGNSGAAQISFGDSDDDDVGAIVYDHNTHYLGFNVNASERVRFQSTGNVSIGISTDNQRLYVYGSHVTDNGLVKVHTSNGSGNNDLLIFYDGNGHECGTISLDASANSVAYNTSSDYRLKENAKNISDGITRLKQLKPYRFNFIDDPDKTVDGFFAHEAQTVVPEAVQGTKDATKTVSNVIVNADGTVEKYDTPKTDWEQGKKDGVFANDSTWEETKEIIKTQKIDQAKLVPLLTAALQEAVAKIEALEARVTTLEG